MAIEDADGEATDVPHGRCECLGKLQAPLESALSDYVKTLANLVGGKSASDLVFTTPEGGPLRHHLFYEPIFKAALQRAGLDPRLRFHDLRHTCAALCIASGAPALAVEERLGHSTIMVTMDVYGHLFPSIEEASR